MREVKLSLDNYQDNYLEIIQTMAERAENDRQPATCSSLICRDFLTLSTWYCEKKLVVFMLGFAGLIPAKPLSQ